MNINYSIVIPHKNIPHLLQRCLASIPVRDDLEVIVVDDNSDPSLVDFDKFPGLGVKNTSVIFTKEGFGAGYARNVGLEKASGKWIVFADCDDYFVNGMLELLDKWCECNFDIVYFNIKSVFSDNGDPSNRHSRRIESLKKYAQSPAKLDKYCRYFYTEPWGKMVRKDLIDKYNIRFEQSIVANDFWFSIQTGFFAHKITLSLDELYVYTDRRGSLSNVMCGSKEKVLARLNVYYNVQEFLKEKRIHFIPFFEFSRDLYNNSEEYRPVVSAFWRSKGMTPIKVDFHYICGKLYQLMIGVRQ